MNKISIKDLLKDKKCYEIHQKLKDKKDPHYSRNCRIFAEEFIKRGDTISALEWLETAAKNNDSYGASNTALGYAYEFGKMYYYETVVSSKPGLFTEDKRIEVDFHLPIDINKALKYYLCAENYTDVARIYYEGKLGKIDYNKAFKYEYMACTKYNKYKPSVLLANMYYYGQCCKQDYQKALIAYKYNMHDLTDNEAENVIVCLERLFEEPQKYMEYKIALALLGYQEFFMLAGDAFEHGKGITINKLKALEMYSLAADSDIEGASEKYDELKENMSNSLFSIFEKYKDTDEFLMKKYNMNKEELKTISFSKNYENKSFIIPDDFDMEKHYKELVIFDLKGYKKQKSLRKNTIGNIIVYAEEKLKNDLELYYNAYYLVVKYYYQRSKIAVKQYPERYSKYYKILEQNKKYKEKLDLLLQYIKDIEYINSSYSKAKLLKCLIDDNLLKLKLTKSIEEQKEDERLERYVSYSGSLYETNTSPNNEDDEEDEYFRDRVTGRKYTLANDDVWDYRGKSIIDDYYGTRTGMRLRGDKIYDDFNNEIGSVSSDGKIKVKRN